VGWSFVPGRGRVNLHRLHNVLERPVDFSAVAAGVVEQIQWTKVRRLFFEI
jgi:hypothetical protein